MLHNVASDLTDSPNNRGAPRDGSAPAVVPKFFARSQELEDERVTPPAEGLTHGSAAASEPLVATAVPGTCSHCSGELPPSFVLIDGRPVHYGCREAALDAETTP